MNWKEIVRRNESIALNKYQSNDARQLAKETAEIIRALRNELCLKCGNYAEEHNGACDGCNWKNTINKCKDCFGASMNDCEQCK